MTQVASNLAQLGAMCILVIGNEGSGKTSSLQTLPPEETLIIQPNTKDLMWGGWESQYILGQNLIRVTSLDNVLAETGKAYTALLNAGKKINYLVIEDTTHLQNERTTSQAFINQNSGNAAFAKWNQFGADFSKLIAEMPKALPSTLTIIYIGHVETKDDGIVDIQTAGKLLDNSIKIPSYFTYVLHARVLRGPNNSVNYVFQTNFDSIYKAKTPRGCFTELFIPNDMKAVIDRIRQFKKN